jgi:hypothetical protein
VTENAATLLCVSRATVSKVMSAYMNRGKSYSGRKSTWTEWDYRRLKRVLQNKLQNCCSTYASKMKTVFILKTLFLQLSYVTFTNQTSVVELHLWLLKVMLRFIKNGITTIKPGHQKTGNAWYGHMSSSSCYSLRQEGFVFGEHTIWNAWW